MNYINNWIGNTTAAMAPGSTTLPVASALLARLGLDSGKEYLLTLTDTLDPLKAAAYEVVKVTKDGVTRAQEGTAANAWPAGSIIFAGVTAGMLASLAQSGSGGGSGLVPGQWKMLTPGPSWQGWAFIRKFGDDTQVWFSLKVTALGGFGVPDDAPFEIASEYWYESSFGGYSWQLTHTYKDPDPGSSREFVEACTGYLQDNALYFTMPPDRSYTIGSRMDGYITFPRVAFPF